MDLGPKFYIKYSPIYENDRNRLVDCCTKLDIDKKRARLINNFNLFKVRKMFFFI